MLSCPSSKLNPNEFIGGFERLAIARVGGGADERNGPGRPKLTPNPRRAGAGIARAAPSNYRAGAQPKSPPLPSYWSAPRSRRSARFDSGSAPRWRVSMDPWKQLGRCELSNIQSVLLLAPERGQIDSLGHRKGGKVRRLAAFGDCRDDLGREKRKPPPAFDCLRPETQLSGGGVTGLSSFKIRNWRSGALHGVSV